MDAYWSSFIVLAIVGLCIIAFLVILLLINDYKNKKSEVITIESNKTDSIAIKIKRELITFIIILLTILLTLYRFFKC
jgi:hypothetical protein